MANTSAQEQTSAWIFRRALNDNKKYKNPDDIWTDPQFKKEIIGTLFRHHIKLNGTDSFRLK